jgi:hypothetical protein
MKEMLERVMNENIDQHHHAANKFEQMKVRMLIDRIKNLRNYFDQKIFQEEILHQEYSFEYLEKESLDSLKINFTNDVTIRWKRFINK